MKVRKFFAWVLVFLFLAFFCSYVFYSTTYHWEAVWKYRSVFLRGWINTVFISIISLVLSLFLGIFWALLRRSSILFLQNLAKVYIETVRGTPLLVQILFFYYVVAEQIGLQNRYIAGVIILSIFSGAYISEIIRSGIENIRATQLETAKAIGLTPLQTYFNIIIPQAVTQILPPLAGQLASLIKDSSLLSVIGIAEMTFSAQQINSATFSTLESFFPLALGYLILTLPVSLFSKHLEKRFAYED